MPESLSIQILPDINPKSYFPDSKHIILYSFSIGDRHFFQFDDVLNVPYARALKCLVYYKELDCNTDSLYLDAHTAAMDALFKKPSISFADVSDMKKLNDLLKQRQLMPKMPDLMYKLAAVVFFDQHENPVDYEFNYGERKIKFWKETTSLTDFFLQKPLVELIPYLKHAGENLNEFSRLSQQVDKESLRVLGSMLPLQLTELKQKLQSKLESYASM